MEDLIRATMVEAVAIVHHADSLLEHATLMTSHSCVAARDAEAAILGGRDEAIIKLLDALIRRHMEAR